MARFTEEERKVLWDMFEAGVPMKRIGRHLGRQHSSIRMHIVYTGGKRPAPRPAPSCVFRWLSEKRSPGDWRQGCRFGPSPRAWAVHRRRCPGR